MLPKRITPFHLIPLVCTVSQLNARIVTSPNKRWGLSSYWWKKSMRIGESNMVAGDVLRAVPVNLPVIH